MNGCTPNKIFQGTFSNTFVLNWNFQNATVRQIKCVADMQHFRWSRLSSYIALGREPDYISYTDKTTKTKIEKTHLIVEILCRLVSIGGRYHMTSSVGVCRCWTNSGRAAPRPCHVLQCAFRPVWLTLYRYSIR
jgi:hypothetical protein